jgi:hypothetical protein
MRRANPCGLVRTEQHTEIARKRCTPWATSSTDLSSFLLHDITNGRVSHVSKRCKADSSAGVSRSTENGFQTALAQRAVFAATAILPGPSCHHNYRSTLHADTLDSSGCKACCGVYLHSCPPSLPLVDTVKSHQTIAALNCVLSLFRTCRSRRCHVVSRIPDAVGLPAEVLCALVCSV